MEPRSKLIPNSTHKQKIYVSKKSKTKKQNKNNKSNNSQKELRSKLIPDTTFPIVRKTTKNKDDSKKKRQQVKQFTKGTCVETITQFYLSSCHKKETYRCPKKTTSQTIHKRTLTRN